MAYTGHGLGWWWPGSPVFQRYVTLVMRVIFSCCGLVLASRFLDLAMQAPTLRRVLAFVECAALAMMALCVATDAHDEAALLALIFLPGFTLATVALGCLAVRRGKTSRGYFLAASLCCLAGTATMALARWGLLPLNTLRFHLMEAGATRW